MKKPEKYPSEEDQAVEELVEEMRGIMIREEAVPPMIATRIEAVIKAEAQKYTTISWKEASTLLCLVFLLAGAVLPWSLTIPLLGICGISSGIYALGVARIIRPVEE